ncbi:flagellar hook-length control protein FliK [Sporosarcina sp. FA9]|uniref:flagellar hook-length control protein FliK n=1 Tax=Sporosarcina sp. FA9 TaxID=3413030 RepID=UPI003F65E35C
MKKINITMSQTVTGISSQGQTSGMQSGNLKENSGFGSIFSGIMAGLPATPIVTEVISEGATDSALLAILNAKTLEELNAVLNAIGVEDLDATIKINDFFKMTELENLEIDPQRLMDNILPLLDAIDTLTPQFFKNLLTSLEGKGEIPKEQAIDLLAFLKTIEVAAPKTDLHVRQEQQVFSLQSMIATIANNFETNLNAKSNGNIELVQLPQQIMRFVMQSDTNQSSNNNDGNPKEAPKDTQTQAISAASSNLANIKSDLPATEVENRNNARNETLLKEMQNLFKRSNFGQAGGTNRLLVKLYPEHLGQVRIELIQTNGVMTARILASTALGKEMLDSQLHQLRASFQQQNLQVDRIDITQTLQDTTRNGRDQAFNQHFKQEQETTEQQQNHDPEDEMTFQEYMIELEA